MNNRQTFRKGVEMLTNKITQEGDIVTIEVPLKKEMYLLKVTSKQLEKINDSFIRTIGVFTDNGKKMARGRGIIAGKKIQPMIHKVLGLKISELVDPFYMVVFDEEPIEDTTESLFSKVKEVKRYEEPVDGQSAEPVRGVSWNKRKNAYEAKATFKRNKDRRFLGYYQPHQVHIANEAVTRWKAEGQAAYKEIMDVYYNLPGRERYRR